MLRTLGDLVLEDTPLSRPKPLLLLAYLALEGPKPRRYLADLFFGDVKDPNDSLSTALKYLKQHTASMLHLQPKIVATEVVCDARTLIDELDEGKVLDAVKYYKGPFLSTLNLTLGEELEDWVFTQQDRIAQQLRNALLDQVEVSEGRAGVKLAEQAWTLTKDQGVDAEALNRLYHALAAGASPLAHDVRKFANEYGLPLMPPGAPTRPDALTLASPYSLPVLPPQVRALTDRFENLRYGAGGFAFCLWGEPGIGKSWALEHLKRTLSFHSYIVPAALPAQLAPYHLPRATSLPQWTRTVLTRLAAAEPVRPEDAADAIAEVMAANAPILLQVEDLHEALPERIAFWNLVAQAIKRSPNVSLLATSRRPPSEIFEAEKLDALTPEDTANLLEQQAGTTLPVETQAWIYARAAGNPLFTLEYFRYLRRQGRLWHDGRTWRWRPPEDPHLPATIESLVSQTVDGVPLSESVRMFVEIKALLPATVSKTSLALAAGLNDTDVNRTEQALVNQGILREHDFVHPLYREVQVLGMAPARRQRWAKQIVVTLGESDPETAAGFVKDADLPDEHTLSLIVRAAALASAQGRARRAGELAATAVDYAQANDRITLRLQAAAHLKHAHTSRARELAERVLAADPENVDALLIFVECLSLLGEGERAEKVLGRVQTESTQQQVFELLVSLRTNRNDYPGAVALWERQPQRQQQARPQSKSRAAFSLTNLGRFTDGDNLVKATLEEVLSSEERADLLETRGVIAYYTGNMAAGLDYFNESVALLRALPEPDISPKLMQVLRLRATTYWAFLRQSDAVRDTEEAMSIASALGSGRDYAIAQTYLGIPLTELSEYEKAEEALLESREVLRRADAREHLAACEAVLGGVYINWQLPGMTARALSHTHASLRISEDIGAPVLVSQSSFYVAWAELIAGNAEVAEGYITHGLTIAQEMGQRRFAALSYWIRSLVHEQLGRVQDAISDLDAAIVLAEDMSLEGLRLLFLIDRDRLRDDRVAVRHHLIVSRPYNLSGFKLPVRQQFIDMLDM